MNNYTPAELHRSLYQGWRKLSRFRKLRKLCVEQYAGPYYRKVYPAGDDSRPDTTKRPINLLYQVVSTLLPQLVGKSVKVDVNARSAQLGPWGRLRQLRVERLLDEIDFPGVDEMVTLDALMGGLGIWRVGLRAGSSLYDVGGELFDVGQPYAARVDLDDFARDPLSRVPEEDGWRANRVRVPRQYLLDTGLIDPDAVRSLQTINAQMMGNKPGEVETLTSNESGAANDRPFQDMVALWDFTLYDGDKKYTCWVADDRQDEFLMPIREFEGPERGPYEFLQFLQIPNNNMPASVAGQLIDLHLALAAVATKLTKQILTAKTIFTYEPNGEDTAAKVRDADDLEILAVQGGGAGVNVHELGGIINQLYPGLDMMMSMANNQGLSFQVLQGSKDVGKTATVGQILQNNSQTILSKLRDTCLATKTRVVRQLAWYMENDPLAQEVYPVRLPGGEMIDVQWDAQAKEGDWEDFNFQVRPFNPPTIDPNADRLRFIEAMQNVAPFAQAVAQLGGNVQAAMKLVATKFDDPAWDEIFPTPEGQQMGQLLAQQPRGQAIGMQPAGPAGAQANGGAGRTMIQQQQADNAATYSGAR